MNKIGVCGSYRILGGLEGKIDFVEEHVQRLLVPLATERALAESTANITDATVPISTANCFLPSEIRSTGPGVDVPQITAYARTAFQRAAAVGIGIVVYGSGGSRALPEGYDRSEAEEQFVTILRTIGPIAGTAGIVIVVEPLAGADCNFINNLAQGAEAVRAANHPNVALLADFYHMMREDEGPDQIEKYGNLIRHVHAAELADRAAPGTAGDDFRPYLRALNNSGYRGDYALECRWNDPVAEAVSGVAELRTQLAEVW